MTSPPVDFCLAYRVSRFACIVLLSADCLLSGSVQMFQVCCRMYSNCAALLATLAACYTQLYNYISYKIYTG